MGSNRSVRGLTVPLLVLAVVPSALVSAGATRADASTCGSFNRATGPAAAGELSNAAFVSAGESWAVGNVGSALKPNQTLIERFNGSAWSVVPSPNQGAGNNALNGVSMIPGAGWAVGYAQAGTYQPLALGWDGTQWSLAPAGTFPGDALFTGVDTMADGSAWAVGFQRTATFVDDPAMGLDLNVGSLCAHTVDYNSDGRPDLLVCGETGGLHLFENDQGQGFTDVSSILGAQVNAVDAAMVDVNHDSRPDLITLTGTKVAERLQLANGTFGKSKNIFTVTSGRTLAVGDVNGDNNPDIYVVCGRIGASNAPDSLLIGNAAGAFTSMTIPQTTAGGGNRAYPLDYTHDGLSSFLVLKRPGPEPRPDPAPHPAAHVHARTDTNGLFSQWRRAIERGAARSDLLRQPGTFLGGRHYDQRAG